MRRAGLAEVREIALRAPRPPLEVPVTRAMCDLEYSFITDKEKLAVLPSICLGKAATTCCSVVLKLKVEM
jgi:hypothetical protein